ncbi:hypothetical protein FA15DRAFT_578044, partial [Coprinopsis marcescibilis]
TTTGDAEPYFRCVLTWKTCSPFQGAQVFSHHMEEGLLMSFKQLLMDKDPDFVVGYNSSNFDVPYLLRRAASLGLISFLSLGRI